MTEPMTEPLKTPKLNAALAKVQAALPKLERDRTVTVEPRDPKKDPYSYSYATLANLSEALLPLLAKHGLAFTSLPGLGPDGKFGLNYSLLHESGEEKTGHFPLSAEGGIQMIGGRITYARRYCLQSVTGIVADEDDEAQLTEEGPARTAQRGRQTPRARVAAAPAEEGKTAQRARAAAPPVDNKTAQRARAAATPPPLPGENEPAADLITKPQLTKLHILMQETGFTDRDEALAYLSAKAEREITSSKELTKREAMRIIDTLESLDAGPPEGDPGEPETQGSLYNQHDPARRGAR